ncbi:ELO-6 protein [Aphelenchoides avenae]|nr:ELO-6 protein [Aphelenchus avenae]
MEGFLRVSLHSPFDYTAARQYVSEVQWPAFWVSMGYIVVIFSIKAAMQNRKPFDLKLPLQLWNLWLALFSIGGSLVTSKALYDEISTKGLVSSYTHAGAFFQGVSGLWSFWFCMSKLAELGDTLFIVLRKRPLMFLHWYHHVATLNYGLLSYAENTSYNTWIVWLNFTVHAVMYSYYTLAAMKIRVPAAIAQCITLMQITQFVITHFILFHSGYKMLVGEHVDTTVHTYWYCLLMEISYLVLFGNFFYHSYIKNGGKKFQREKAQTVEKKVE